MDAIELTDGVIVLRTPTLDDADAVVEAVQASLEHLRPFMPWATGAYDVDAARQWINGEIDPAAHAFVIVDGDDRIVGSAGVNRIDSLNDGADIGYWLRPDATGKGYATRAANLLLEYAVEQIGLHRVEIYMSVENTASRRVAERTAAQYEGVQRGRLKIRGRYHDAHMYAFVNPTS